MSDEEDVYPVNPELCIIPSKDGESQYEAFQSVLAYIMSSRTELPEHIKHYNPYELACYKNGIILKSFKRHKNKNELKKWFEKDIEKDIEKKYPKRLIFFVSDSNSQDLSTHYIGLEKKSELDEITIKDPYKSVQAVNTEGFCQMFAFFLLTDNSGFLHVDQKKKIEVEEFNKLCHNTQLCFSKFISLLKLNPDIFKKFKQEFCKIDFKYYGIKPHTTCETYLSHFKILNNEDTPVKYYIYDQPLVGWRQLVEKGSLWDSFVVKEEDVKGGNHPKRRIPKRRIPKRRISKRKISKRRISKTIKNIIN